MQRKRKRGRPCIEEGLLSDQHGQEYCRERSSQYEEVGVVDHPISYHTERPLRPRKKYALL